MVTAIVTMKNGELKPFYADGFPELFKQLEPYENEVVSIKGKAILLKDMRQGKEILNNGKSL